MKTTLIRHANLVATFDDRQREIRDGAILVRGHLIEQVGATSELPSEADEIIDARAVRVDVEVVGDRRAAAQQ